MLLCVYLDKLFKVKEYYQRALNICLVFSSTSLHLNLIKALKVGFTTAHILQQK